MSKRHVFCSLHTQSTAFLDTSHSLKIAMYTEVSSGNVTSPTIWARSFLALRVMTLMGRFCRWRESALLPFTLWTSSLEYMLGKSELIFWRISITLISTHSLQELDHYMPWGLIAAQQKCLWRDILPVFSTFLLSQVRLPSFVWLEITCNSSHLVNDFESLWPCCLNIALDP